MEDDWQSVNAAKQQLLAKLLPANSSIPIASKFPTPKPCLSPQPSPSITSNFPSSSKANLKAETAIQTDWESGFRVNMRVTIQGNTSIENWRLTFQMNQAAINNTWNGAFLPQGSQYVVTPAEWGRTLQPNQTLDLGFCANKLGSDYQPKQVSASSL